MINIKEIFVTWIIALNPSEEQRNIAEQRLNICNVCEHSKHDSIANIHYCDACGCPLKGKVFSEAKESCPKQKWEV